MSTRPSKIVCVGRSYADHAKELGNAIPDRPVLFIKPPSSLITFRSRVFHGIQHGAIVTMNVNSACGLTSTLKAETDPAKALQAVGAVTLGLDLTYVIYRMT